MLSTSVDSCDRHNCLNLEAARLLGSGPVEEHVEEVDAVVLVAFGGVVALGFEEAWDAIADLFHGSSDTTWESDQELVDQSITNPWDNA